MSKRTVTPIIAGLAMLLLLPGMASAKTLKFDGEAKGDEFTSIFFEAKGKKKNGKFKANKVLDVYVNRQSFECVNANGESVGLAGRTTYYGWQSLGPMKVNKKGKFSGSYEDKVTTLGGTRTVESFKFEGKIKNKWAVGTYQAKVSEGGIEYGYCGDPVPRKWEAKVRAG